MISWIWLILVFPAGFILGALAIGVIGYVFDRIVRRF